MKNKQKTNFVEEETTFRELAERIGITDLDTPEIYDIRDENYEILSYDHETKQETWKPLNAFVVKENTEEHYQANTLHGTKDHRIFVNGEYVRLGDYAGAELVKQPIQVVDCEVEDTHNYIAEGQINHNTTTPGGMAIPYASSIRIRIQSTGQQTITDNNKNPIGIKVKAKTIKNKIARPFRECEFGIIFGQGIKEHEEAFDLLRTHCAELPKDQLGVKHKGKFLSVEGTGAWKYFKVIDAGTGEEEINDKFHKADFHKILYKPEYKEYIQALFDDALIVQPTSKNHQTLSDLDSNSIEEVNATKTKD